MMQVFKRIMCEFFFLIFRGISATHREERERESDGEPGPFRTYTHCWNHIQNIWLDNGQVLEA